jgi:hypothetical protein
MNQPQPFYTPRADLSEPGSELAVNGFTQRNNIQIGMNVVVRAARTRSERERGAILWLANYARREKLTADALTEALGLDRAAIRAALTNPEADIKQFVGKVESLRTVLDANLKEPANTRVHRDVTEALEFATESGAIVEVIGKTRMGKTESAEHFHLKNLQRSIYCVCPATDSYSDFIFALGRACGVSVGGGKMVTQIEAQIRAMFGRGGLTFLIMDEGQRLWPSDIRIKPKRIEFLRTLWDENKKEIGIVVLATPQYSVSMNQALTKSERWAPGQWEGRVVRWHCQDTMSRADLAKVASFHCPEADTPMIDQLVLGALGTEGFCGAMVNAITLARFKAKREGHAPNLQDIVNAQAQMAAGTEIERLAKKGARR